MTLFLLILLLVTSVFGTIYRIKTPEDFSDFVKTIYGGTDCSGDTVYLDSDLSLPNVTDSISNNTYPFKGTFDGQGHVISDLAINTTSASNGGFFGCSSGSTIRNIVLVDSCSIVNSFNKANNIVMGGIIGDCYGCTVENNVNMLV